MPPEMVTIIRERVVLVAVYVETPKQIRFSANHHRRLHRASNGSNRRADLLGHSRRLRDSGRSSLHKNSKPESSSSDNQQPMKQMSPLQSNSKQGRTLTCLGNSRMEVPSFLQCLVSQCKKGLKANKKKRESEPKATQMKIIMRSFQKQKKPGTFSKFFTGMRKT